MTTFMENANRRAEANRKAEEMKERAENAEKALQDREAAPCQVCEGKQKDCITVEEEALQELAGLWNTDQQMQVRTELQAQ